MSDTVPSTLPFPTASLAEPLWTLVNQSRHTTGWITAVTRIFEPHVGFCGRCPRERCNVTQGVCLVSVHGLVPEEKAWDLRVDTLPWLETPAPQDLGRRGGDGRI